MLNKKIYVLLDECVWDYEPLTNIIGVTNNEEVAKNLLKDYVKRVKQEVNFDELDIMEDDGEHCHNGNVEWLYEESEDHFSLCENGNYSKNHINVNIEVRPILRECDYGNKDTKFTVIENKSKVIYEDKDLALRCYLDLCEIGDYPTRNRFFDTYLKIKNCKGNIISDNSKIEECYKYTYKDYEEENNFDTKINDEKTL